MASYIPRDISQVGTVNPTLSWRVFVFALLATTATIVLFGLVPALRASQVDLNEPIKDGAGTTTGRVRNRYSALVLAEGALFLVSLWACLAPAIRATRADPLEVLRSS